MISERALRSAARALHDECEVAPADPEASRRVILAALIERCRRRTHFERGVTVAMFGLAAIVGLWRHPGRPIESAASAPSAGAPAVTTVAVAPTPQPAAVGVASPARVAVMETVVVAARHENRMRAPHARVHAAPSRLLDRPVLREPALVALNAQDQPTDRPIEASDVLHPTWNTRVRDEISHHWNLRDTAARSARIIAMDSRAERASVPVLDAASPSGWNLNPVTLCAWR